MTDLVLDTSLNRDLMAGIYQGGAALWEGHLSDSRGDQLYALLSRGFEEAGIKSGEVSRILVCRGPGSFTGLRIGLAFVQGFAAQNDVPVWTINTLQALLLQADWNKLNTAEVYVHSRGSEYYRGYAENGNIETAVCTCVTLEENHHFTGEVVGIYGSEPPSLKNSEKKIMRFPQEYQLSPLLPWFDKNLPCGRTVDIKPEYLQIPVFKTHVPAR